MKAPRLLAILSLLAITVVARAAPDKLFKLTVQLDWVAEPEHGGFFQAQAKGFFRDEGLHVTIVPGGPNAFVIPKTATGQADIGLAHRTNTLRQIAEGIPLIQNPPGSQD